MEFLERAEREEEKVALKAKTENEVREQHLQAFVEDMDDNQLYEKLLTSDPNGQALLLIGEDVEDIFKKLVYIYLFKCTFLLIHASIPHYEYAELTGTWFQSAFLLF